METFGTGQGYLKAGFLGFNKSGKTHTAMLLAIELRRRMNLDAPIALFDTEASGEYIAARIKAATGKDLIGRKSRAFSDLMRMARECEAGAASILIVDSMTHVAREVVSAYLDQINRIRAADNKGARTRMEFQDFRAIKAKWTTWADYFLNSRLHIIICGRAGFEWDFQETQDSVGNVHKELIKTGVKMKCEADSEFGFEPSLLVGMERLQVEDPKSKTHFSLIHRATVLGDRFDSMDGKSCDNPTGKWFAPHLDLLTPGAVNQVDTTLKTEMAVDQSGDAEWNRERRRRVVLCEEIEGEIVKAYPGQSKEEKRAKALLVEKALGTTSWTAVTNMQSDKLERGLAFIRETLPQQEPPPPPPPMPTDFAPAPKEKEGD